tara:strand:+ start:2610 stop:2858 length:249 start_codon:yes stop_codon:yes gene_type:complete
MSESSFVVRANVGNLGWVVRFSNHELGETPVGPRLAKGERFPSEIGTHFDFKEDAEVACKRWAEWYCKQPYLKKKRKSKYVA